MSSSLYKDLILEYYRHPRNFGTFENPDFKARDSNPLCGDEIEFQVKLDGEGKVEEARYSGKGCAISQASASMLTEIIQGKTVEELKQLGKQDILDMLGIELSHVRIKCALLSLKTLKTGLYSYLGSKMNQQEEKDLG